MSMFMRVRRAKGCMITVCIHIKIRFCPQNGTAVWQTIWIYICCFYSAIIKLEIQTKVS